MIYIEKTDIGATLTTWIYCAMWQLYSAEQQGKRAYINWYDSNNRCLKDLIDKDKFNEDPNMYNWYFIQPHCHINVGDRKVNTHPGRTETWIWETWKDPLPVSLMAQPLEVMRDFFKRNLIFNNVVNARGQAMVDKYGIDFSKTIGISVRGTDNVTDGRFRIPIERYYKWIDKALNEMPDAKILCTAEEAGHLAPLLVKYPQAVVIGEFRSSPPGSLHNPERNALNDGRSGFERGMQPALMVWLFSKCAWYIKNRSSTGAVASWLSDGNIVNLGHAETLNYDKLDNEDEFKGVRYPI